MFDYQHETPMIFRMNQHVALHTLTLISMTGAVSLETSSRKNLRI